MLHNGSITLTLTVSGILVLCFMLIFFIRKKKTKFIRLVNETTATTTKQNLEQLREIADKLDFLLTNKKMYTNPELSIQDLADMIGTNRSYVSSSINIFYNQNFCSYINQYRLNELKDTIQEDTTVFTQKELAFRCGFGSIDTMKRAVKQKTGLSMKDWREYIAQEKGLFDNNSIRQANN
jgi:AraC-like DNA-binding protein